MDGDSPPSFGLGTPEGSNRSGEFSERAWERQIAEPFLRWRDESDLALRRLRLIAASVDVVFDQWIDDRTDELAAELPRVLYACDELPFESPNEVIAYAALHLVDRYGRVTQLLEHLLSVGRVPLRLHRLKVLEVGAGPAPALFAIRDFYADLRSWPDRGTTEVAAVSDLHCLERSSTWGSYLHQVSEALMWLGGDGVGEGSFVFQRELDQFEGLDLWRRHHDERHALARQIQEEYDRDDMWISSSNAWRLAYESPTVPSAYDVIVMCNFLTTQDMLSRYTTELRRLSRSLTPGGVLLLLSGVGAQYVGIRQRLSELAEQVGLRRVEVPETIPANSDPRRRQVVASHARAGIDRIKSRCGSDTWAAVEAQLIDLGAGDLLDEGVEFRLPSFGILAFANDR